MILLAEIFRLAKPGQGSQELLDDPVQKNHSRHTQPAGMDHQRSRRVEWSEQEGQGDGIGRVGVSVLSMEAQRRSVLGQVRTEAV